MKWFSFLFVFAFAVQASAAEKFAPKNRPIDVEHYDIGVTIDPKTAKDRFDAEVTLKLKLLKDAKTIELDAHDLQIKKATWNGEPVTHKTTGELLTVTLPGSVAADTQGSLFFEYRGKIHEENDGFFRVKDPDAPERGPLFFTQLEATSARRFFPCNDEPADKASMDVWAVIPQGIDMISSGLLVSDKPVQRPGKILHQVRWSLRQPHSTYLANIAIGSFAKMEKKHRDIIVSVYASKKALPKTAFVLDTNLKAIEFLEGYLHTPYPWPKYASVGLPTFVWGGMENTSTTFLNQDRMVQHDPKAEEEKLHMAMLTNHELGHQWFGDLVTMKWWDDIWLNEAFASFASFKATEAQFSKDEMAVIGATYLWDEYFRQEDGPRSHPIVRKDLSSPSDAFDGISYTKGEQVLRMLEFYLGEDAFRKGLGAYLKQYSFANATYVDFFNVMEKSSGRDLKSFRDSWLLQRGYPVISYRTEWDTSDKELKVTFEQKPNHAGEDYGFSFRMPVVFHRRSEPAYDQSLTVEFSAKKKSTEILAALPAEPEWITLNPTGVILAKVSLDTSASDTYSLSLQAQYDPDVTTRMWALNELARPLEAGKPVSAEVEEVLAKAVLTEKSPYGRIGMLYAIERLNAASLPPVLSQAMVEAYEQTALKSSDWAKASESDPHGWELWKTRLLRQMAKANHPKVYPIVASALTKTTSSLDEVASAAFAMASLGDKRSLPLLQQAMQKQGSRGYRYRFWVQYSMGAIPNDSAVGEIRKLANSASADLMGRIPTVIENNEALKTSPRWAKFLEEFLTKDKKFGETVKMRMLNTIEDVKNDAVKELLTKLKDNKDGQIKESAERILAKNFKG